jgi:D-glycero-alpha-D-manno-heptose-7-phosphate kinase
MARTVTATAPVRVCDLGGWTDTWFARRGLVVSIAVRPGATARVTYHPSGTRPERVTVGAPDLPGGPDALVWAVVEHTAWDADLEIEVSSGVPPGAGMGTSAAVTVALLAAFDERAGPGELAARAHAIEVGHLGREGGVQDQVAAAYGGVNRITIDPYPSTRVEPIPAPRGLAGCLRTVYLGAPHNSDAVHREVIGAISAEGPSSLRLERLRRVAAAGYDALVAGDLGALGRAMTDSTDAQADLAPGIVGDDALAVVEVARATGARGWKVNGAGGGGGTVTVLLARPGDRAAFDDAVVVAGYTPLEVDLSETGVGRETGDSREAREAR